MASCHHRRPPTLLDKPQPDLYGLNHEEILRQPVPKLGAGAFPRPDFGSIMRKFSSSVLPYWGQNFLAEADNATGKPTADDDIACRCGGSPLIARLTVIFSQMFAARG